MPGSGQNADPSIAEIYICGAPPLPCRWGGDLCQIYDMAAGRALTAWVCIVASVPVLSQATFNPKNVAQGSSSYPSAVQLSLSNLFNNRGFAMSPGDADFDGLGSKYNSRSVAGKSFVLLTARFKKKRRQNGRPVSSPLNTPSVYVFLLREENHLCIVVGRYFCTSYSRFPKTGSHLKLV